MVLETEELFEMVTQRISVVSDQSNELGYNKEKGDSFLVDIDGFGHSEDKDSSPNSHITWQRNLSRKGSLRGAGEKRMCSSPTSNERDGSLVSVASSSPKAVGTSDQPANSPSHHQITITAGNVGTNDADSKWSNRRSYSFRRPPPTWAIDPRKILFFFATLSSMGTILLIFLTLSMRKTVMEDGVLE
ncbi:unnamed protein product [Rhodiola kirilowii]